MWKLNRQNYSSLPIIGHIITPHLTNRMFNKNTNLPTMFTHHDQTMAYVYYHRIPFYENDAPFIPDEMFRHAFNSQFFVHEISTKS